MSASAPTTPPRLAPALLALAAAYAALLSDWLTGELFMRRDSVAHIAGALAIAAAVAAAIAATGARLLPRRAFAVALRTLALAAGAGLVLWGLRAAAGPSVASGPVLRVLLLALALGAALALTLRLADATADRLMQTVVVAALAFMVTPVLLRAASAPPRVWIGPPAAGAATPRATLFLLFDEFSFDAAAPLADDLRRTGMNVRFQPLVPAGDGTLKAMPALFTGTGFRNARPCGASTLCSVGAVADFSRVAVQRADVDVTGLLVPYCDIPRLRSCFQMPLPHEFGSSYRSLAVFHLRRLALPVPAWLQPPADPPGQKGTLLAQQLAFIDAARVWTDGGILYAHLPLPHPPDLDGPDSLDADYAANIALARQLLARWVARARTRFGYAFSIVVTSDHPLRDYWCTDGVYRGAACNARPAFHSTTVPLIVASPGPVSARPVAGNIDVFRILNDQAGSVLP